MSDDDLLQLQRIVVSFIIVRNWYCKRFIVCILRGLNDGTIIVVVICRLIGERIHSRQLVMANSAHAHLLDRLLPELKHGLVRVRTSLSLHTMRRENEE